MALSPQIAYLGWTNIVGEANRKRNKLIEDIKFQIDKENLSREYEFTESQKAQMVANVLYGVGLSSPITMPSYETILRGANIQPYDNPDIQYGKMGIYLRSLFEKPAGVVNNVTDTQMNQLVLSTLGQFKKNPDVKPVDPNAPIVDTTDYSGETQAEFNARRLAALNSAAEQLGGYGALARDVASGKVSVRDLWANMGASNAYDISPDNWRNLGGWDKNAANGLTAFMNAFNMKYTAPKDGGGDGGGISAPETPSYPTWEEFLKVHPLTKEEVWAKQEQARINTINESVYGTPETGSTGAVGDINELMAARGLLESGATGQALTSLGVTTEKAKEAERLQTANDKAQELKSLTDQYGQGYLSFFNQSVAGAQSAREQAAAIEAAKAAAIFSGAQQDKTNYQNFLYQQQLAAGSKPKFYTTPEFSTQATSGGGGNLLNTLMAGLGLLGGPVGAGISSVFNIASGIFGGGQTAEQKWPSAFTGLNTLLAPTNQTIRNPWQPRSNWGL